MRWSVMPASSRARVLGGIGDLNGGITVDNPAADLQVERNQVS